MLACTSARAIADENSSREKPMPEKKRVGILTGGGDAPGLNAVIYGALLRAYEAGNIELVGIKKGWKLFDMPKEKMTPDIIEKYLVALDIAELDACLAGKREFTIVLDDPEGFSYVLPIDEQYA